MRKDYLFLASLTLAAAAILFFFGLSALPKLNLGAITAIQSTGSDLTPIEQPTVSFVNPALGDVAAPVAVVVFADYLCAACAQLDATLRQLAMEPTSGFRYVWKDFPTSADAIDLALAGRCAGAVGKFWEYHDLLMARNMKKADAAELVTLAEQLGLNATAFRGCLDDRTTEPLVERDFEEGQRLRIDATPYLFIGGRRISGAIEADLIRSMVREAANRAYDAGPGAATPSITP